MSNISGQCEDNIFENELTNLTNSVKKAESLNTEINDVLNLKNVSTELLKNKLVNKSIVKTLFTYIPELKEKVVLESFTESLTSVIFSEFSDVVDNKINEKIDKVKDDLTKYYDSDVKYTLNTIDAFLNSNFTDFRYLISDLQKLSLDTLDLISKTKNTIIPIKTETVEFIDIVAINYKELKKFNIVESESIDIKTLLEALDVITSVIESNAVMSYIFHSFAESKDIDLNAFVYNTHEYKDSSITIEKILKFFASDKTKIFINNIDKELLDIKVNIERELEEIDNKEELSINISITNDINKTLNIFTGLFNISRLSKTTFKVIDTIRLLLV